MKLKVEKEKNGITYNADAVIDESEYPMITVTSSLGVKTTQVGGHVGYEKQLAEMLLSEMIEQNT